jgi:hypothetical protein
MIKARLKKQTQIYGTLVHKKPFYLQRYCQRNERIGMDFELYRAPQFYFKSFYKKVIGQWFFIYYYCVPKLSALQPFYGKFS